MIGAIVRIGLVAILCHSFGAEAAHGAEAMRRFVLAAGANLGGHSRIPLQYAISDAEKFTEVMVSMGGVRSTDRVLLSDPDRSGLERAVEELRTRVAAAKLEAWRTEVFVYYSGHADEKGLLIGEERLDYRELRGLMDRIDADVRIAILDACASGAITRIKGGTRRNAFEVDTSSDMRGYAFLTSSSAEETAQESDRIQASFFTHYLISGMRGAADVSDDGKVTLNEAYQFAYNETLNRTVESQGGAQHPAYHINLSGTGDVVMTDLRQTSAGLVLGKQLNGRLFVRNDDDQLLAELHKPRGRIIEIALEPGEYGIHLEHKEDLFLARTEVVVGQRTEVVRSQFEPVSREQTARRGQVRPGGRAATYLDPRSASMPFGGLAGRARLEFHLGTVGPQPQLLPDSQENLRGQEAAADAEDTAGFTPLPTANVDPWSVLSGLTLGYWITEDFSVNLSYSALGSEVANIDGPSSVDFRLSRVDISLASVQLGVGRHFTMPYLSPLLRAQVSTSVGSFIGHVDGETIGAAPLTWKRTMRSVGGQVGTGIDLQINRYLMVGARGGYNLMADFDEPLGGRDNYSGAEFSLGLSWIIGGGGPR